MIKASKSEYDVLNVEAFQSVKVKRIKVTFLFQ